MIWKFRNFKGPSGITFRTCDGNIAEKRALKGELSSKRSTRFVPKLEKPKGSEKLRCRHAKSNYDSTNSPAWVYTMGPKTFWKRHFDIHTGI